MTDYVAIAATAFVAFPAGALFMGMFCAGKAGDVPVSDDWHTIARLTDDVRFWREQVDVAWGNTNETLVKLDKARAENADLRIDIAAKRKRLADAGLQTAGGVCE